MTDLRLWKDPIINHSHFCVLVGSEEAVWTSLERLREQIVSDDEEGWRSLRIILYFFFLTGIWCWDNVTDVGSRTAVYFYATPVFLSVWFCSKQVEKEKRELARQYGMVRSEVSGGEIAEELEKERRSFQLGMCEVSHWLHTQTHTHLGVSCLISYFFWSENHSNVF